VGAPDVVAWPLLRRGVLLVDAVPAGKPCRAEEAYFSERIALPPEH
jgi:hypothetical protein